jgi:hypothetical protein
VPPLALAVNVMLVPACCGDGTLDVIEFNGSCAVDGDVTTYDIVAWA